MERLERGKVSKFVSVSSHPSMLRAELIGGARLE